VSARPLFHAPCPACGAPVELASSASSFAVCGYCHSHLSRDGDALQATGHKSEVLEDYSPLQLGAGGRWHQRGFTLVGRIQMRYDGGYWNEWRVLFDDTTTGWLSDASGQFAMLHRLPAAQPLPAYASLVPGVPVPLEGLAAVVADKREARCVAAQGELPFAVDDRWSAQVADLRVRDRFFTLDYSDAEPVLYQGHPVTLEQLQMQLLRDEHTINESAGRLKGKLQALSCPHCGGTVKAVAGATPVATCASCGSTLDVQGRTAQLIDKGQRAQARMQGAFLEAGDVGVLKGVSWTVLGVMAQSTRSEGETYRWTDYLLFEAKRGFRWLSQPGADADDDAWLFVEPLDVWPARPDAQRAELRGQRFQLKDRYDSRVERVWGSFNWAVRAGDTAACEEFALQRGTPELPQGSVLTCETTAHEQVWSLGVPLSHAAVATAFGKKTAAARRRPPDGSTARVESLDNAMTLSLFGHGFLWITHPSMFGLLLGVGTLGVLWLLKTAMKG
jgi:ribosomal protein S27E